MDNIIRAIYDDKTIRVYQAYGDAIADEAVQNGAFGNHFNLNRMTWIKPSFLWMMYRSGWAEKEGQTRILAIDMDRAAFDRVVKQSVLTSYNEKIYGTRENWNACLKKSKVRCQWDPERDIYGNPLGYRTIQLGLSGEFAYQYAKEWIVKITDITEYVKKLQLDKKNQKDILPFLPDEKEYPCARDAAWQVSIDQL